MATALKLYALINKSPEALMNSLKLWPFCLNYYQRSNVEPLCLDLQNQYSANVGLIIWFCWHSAHDRYITKDAYTKALSTITPPHRELIEPLRAIRKHKSLTQQVNSAQIKKTLLQAELLLEKSVLEALEVATAALITRNPKVNIVTLKDYFETLGVQDVDTHVRFLYAAARATLE